ncbi:MAG: PKD domain-containing protein, partial [Bacteroidetes bacterium]|nr:PKD domain-containing protein [Bacteroidota bacterium]
MFKSIQRKSLIWGSFVIFSITLASNNIWDYVAADFDLQVSFTSSPADDDSDGTISICEGTTVTFTDTSTEVPVDAAYSWSFPGGDMTSSDTSGPHSVVFNNAGNYFVTLDIDGTTATLNVLVENSPNIDPAVVPNNWGSSTFNGTTYFTSCNNAAGATDYWTNFAFQTASTNTTANSIHTITDVNGDLIFSFVGENFDAPFQFINHAVNSGFTQITYTIEEGSCVYQSTFDLYIGAAPTATISNEGIPVLCFPGSITYNIVPGAQNGPGTIYTIEVSDGSDPVVFNHPPPSTYTHTYNSVSCGQADVEFNDTVYNNAFEISITASNACDQSTNGFAPIYIESGPEASFEFNPDPPNDAVCQGTTLAAIDTTIPGFNISNGECTDDYRKFWQITAPDGSILTSTTSGALDANPFVTVAGNMGFVPGGISTSAESASSFYTGAATQIDITFLQPGNYDVTLFTGSSGQSNRCGITQFTQTV